MEKLFCAKQYPTADIAVVIQTLSSRNLKDLIIVLRKYSILTYNNKEARYECLQWVRYVVRL